MVVEHGAQSRHQGGVVLQGLAHAHHHHVGDNSLWGVEMLAQKMFGKPQLRQNFTGRQIAAETLVAGGAKTATHRTARLRRHTQSAAIVFGNEHGFHRIAVTHIEQPLDGAVSRVVTRDGCERQNLRADLELFAQRLGQIGHLVEVLCAFLVDPAKQLGGSETLLPEPLTKNGQTVEIEIKQVGRHVLRRRCRTQRRWA